MKHHEINTRLALLLDWKEVHVKQSTGVLVGIPPDGPRKMLMCGRYATVPNYHGDLNATAIAEEALLNEGNYEAYTFLLDELDAERKGDGGHCASSSLRSECLLRLFEAWEEAS